MRKFEKISFEQFKKDISDDKELYESYLLPKRSTKNSAGYDIASLEEYTLKPGEAHIFVTGLKVSMNSDEVLYLYGRSSFGYKYNITLANSVGVIDSDFYNNVDNEGHFKVKLINHGDTEVKINIGDRIAQGVICPVIQVEFAEVLKLDETQRGTGGFGSTGIC